MSVLLIDIGNTRVKWARLTNGRLTAQLAAAHENWSARDFARRVFGTARSIERVIVASVASAGVNRAIAAASLQHCGVAAQFVKTKRHAAGVTTKYAEPWRLGVDRFVAVIGAHHLTPDHAVCVVDIGTAMTIDLVDTRGVHHGGAILPGPDLMIQSLLRDTSGIRRRARGGATGQKLFARSTRAAIEQGARYAVAAAVDRAFDEVCRIAGPQSQLILTGGAAHPLQRLIRSKHHFVPDLVLRGLAAYDSTSGLRGGKRK